MRYEIGLRELDASRFNVLPPAHIIPPTIVPTMPPPSPSFVCSPLDSDRPPAAPDLNTNLTHMFHVQPGHLAN